VESATRDSVFPSEYSPDCVPRVAVTGGAKRLSCGYLDFEDLYPSAVGPYWLRPPPSPFYAARYRQRASAEQGPWGFSTSGFHRRRTQAPFDGLASRALGFHYRVHPQRLASFTPRSAPLAPPLGFISLRRHQLGRSLRRIASPSPSALSVSHALSGLIPPGPCSFVSCCSRPWDLGLQRFSHQLSRCASQRPLPPCRCSRDRCRVHPTPRPCSELASVPDGEAVTPAARPLRS
jgi:hypothetical protein